MTKRKGTFFPTPAFLRMASVGLDISDKSIKYAELAEFKGSLRILRHGEVLVPPGVIVSGKIEDKKKMIEILKALKKKESLKFIRASLPEEQIYSFEIQVPVGKENAVREAIELSLEEHIPIKAQDATFDFEVIKDDGKNVLASVSAAPVSFVDSYVDIFKSAGLVPLSFELEAGAIARAIVPKGDKKYFMIVDFGQTRTGISIVGENSVKFTTSIDLGGFALTRMIEKSIGVTFEEAEKLKLDVGLDSSSEKNDVYNAILSGVGVLRDEINKHYVYWHTHKNDDGSVRPKIDKIIFCGGNANLKGLMEYLESTLRTDVEIGNPWVNIFDLKDEVPSIQRDEALSYTPALGLALADFFYD